MKTFITIIVLCLVGLTVGCGSAKTYGIGEQAMSGDLAIVVQEYKCETGYYFTGHNEDRDIYLYKIEVEIENNGLDPLGVSSASMKLQFGSGEKYSVYDYYIEPRTIQPKMKAKGSVYFEVPYEDESGRTEFRYEPPGEQAIGIMLTEG